MVNYDFKIVSSFSFSEPHELNTLLVKLNVEDAGVSEWVITENTYSFRGEYKGPHQLRNILETDGRFKKFLPKIKLFEVEIQIPCKIGEEDLTILFTQRDVQKEYIEQKYNAEDWILVGDLDEIIDFANTDRYEIVYDTLRSQQGVIVHPNPLFYIFDYDNLVVGNEWYNLAFIQVNWSSKHNSPLEKARVYHAEGYMMPPGSCGYHYHSVCSPQGLWRKLQTYGHTNWVKDDINKCLYYNHGLFRSKLGEKFNVAQFNITPIELTPQNSPQYVRDNLLWLKTDTVHRNFRRNRINYQNGILLPTPDIIAGEKEIMSETSICRDLVIEYCQGNGLDLGPGGDPVRPDCVGVDLPVPYIHMGDTPVNLKGDARDLYWFKDSVLDYVYSSHLLEDFPPEEMPSVLREWLRVIKPGGYLVLYLPDEQKYRAYCERQGEPRNMAHRNPELSLGWFMSNMLPQMEGVVVKYATEIDYSFVMVMQRS
jgi:hypothetical protein